MFGVTRSGAHLLWKRVEKDFVLGACSRQLFGYISQGADGDWTAFDGDARPVGVFAVLTEAQEALWGAHAPFHRGRCEADRSWWSRARKPAAEQPTAV